jgi:hypothetical protein
MGSASSKAARSVTRKYPAQAAKGAIGRAQPSNLEPEHRSKENSAASHSKYAPERDHAVY